MVYEPQYRVDATINEIKDVIHDDKTPERHKELFRWVLDKIEELTEDNHELEMMNSELKDELDQLSTQEKWD